MQKRYFLDTNILDKISFNFELISELENRKDIRLFISDIQEQEVDKISDPKKKQAINFVIKNICYKIANSCSQYQTKNSKYINDNILIDTAIRHKTILVSDDNKMTETAINLGLSVINYKKFVSIMFR